MATASYIQSPQYTYRILSKIGQGSYGEVFKAINQFKQLDVAIKKINRLSKYELETLTILSRNRFNYVVNILEIFEKENLHYVVMELCEESLRTIMPTLKEENKILDYFQQIAKGLGEIHSLGLIHRDIKPENILLLNSQQNLKICDLELMISQNEQKASRIGTPLYMAPEYFKKEYFNQKIDIWALGLVLYEMITNQRFFDAKSKEELNSLINLATQDQIDEKIDKIENCGNITKDLLKCTLMKVSICRLSWSSIIQKLNPSLNKQTIENQMKEQRELEARMQEKQELFIQNNINEQKENVLNSLREKIGYKFNQEFCQWKHYQEKHYSDLLEKELYEYEKSLFGEQFQKKSQLIYPNKKSFTLQQVKEKRQALEEEYQVTFEKEIQEKQKKIEILAEKFVQEEYEEVRYQQIRKYKQFLIEVQNNQDQIHLENARKLLVTYQTLIGFQINILIQKDSQIPLQIEENEELKKAKRNISELIKVYSKNAQEIQSDLDRLENFITLNQINEIIQVYNNKIADLQNVQKIQLEEINQILQIGAQNDEQNSIVLQKLIQGLHEKDKARQLLKEEIDSEVNQWNNQLKLSSFYSSDIKKQLSQIKRKFLNYQAEIDTMTQHYPIMQIDFSNNFVQKADILDQISWVSSQIEQMSEQVHQFKVLKQDILTFKQKCQEEKDQFKNKIIFEYNIIFDEAEQCARNFSFISKIRKKDYPSRIKILRKEMKKKVKELNDELFKMPRLVDISKDSEIENQDEQIKYFHQKVQSLKDEIQTLNSQLERELIQFNAEKQINLEKNEILVQLLQQLEFNHLIKSLYEQLNSLTAEIGEFSVFEEFAQINSNLLFQEEKVRIVEGQIQELQMKIREFNYNFKSIEELQEFQTSYQEKIAEIKHKLLQFESQIQQQRTYFNQSFPADTRFIKSKRQFQIFAEKILVVLRLKIQEKKKNLSTYEQIIKNQEFSLSVQDLSVNEEELFLKSKKDYLEKQCSQAENDLSLHQQSIINHKLIQLINKLSDQIRFCEQGLRKFRCLELNKLKSLMKEFEGKLIEETQIIKKYQTLFLQISSHSQDQNLENFSLSYNEYRNRFFQINQFSVQFDFHQKWEQLIDQIKIQFTHVCAIKCHSIILKQLEIQDICETLLQNKQEEVEVTEFLKFALETNSYYKDFLIFSLERPILIENQRFIIQYQNINAQSGKILEKLHKLIQPQAAEQQLEIDENKKDMLFLASKDEYFFLLH